LPFHRSESILGVTKVRDFSPLIVPGIEPTNAAAFFLNDGDSLDFFLYWRAFHPIYPARRRWRCLPHQKRARPPRHRSPRPRSSTAPAAWACVCVRASALFCLVKIFGRKKKASSCAAAKEKDGEEEAQFILYGRPFSPPKRKVGALKIGLGLMDLRRDIRPAEYGLSNWLGSCTSDAHGGSLDG